MNLLRYLLKKYTGIKNPLGVIFCVITPVCMSFFRRSLMDIGGGGGGGPPAKQRDIEGALLR